MGKQADSATFIVSVKKMENATWQGQIVWADENRKQHFRSLLEMLRLMDGALTTGELGDEEPEEGQLRRWTI